MTFRALALCFLTAGALAAPIGSPEGATASGPPTCGGMAATIVGTSGNDVLTGTAGDDVIVGLKGDDVIDGGLGADRICGRGGDDSITGNGGTDHLFGGAGVDYMDGGVGGCCDASANTGDDVLSGGIGDDNLHASDFSTTGNTIHGRQGADDIYLYSGGAAYGGKGRDTLSQYAGDATLEGGIGADTLGNANNPAIDHVIIRGGDGSDTLTSDDTTGTTAMNGNRGRDVCTGGTSTVHCES
ncbi:hypothetical protein D0Z08_17870 [Nocardioides immobilis]|uniref:Calcium-binding protein n=1 Tax=Nocardioides immobilis TaxID=2049295 RepID=A0A417XZ49_9ACTN|nr:calcium-binding protein [Nocardioides immobilis]RHW25648.1 hypothetical protein D0Z08_17870 [Nocardioides immobilis]